MRGLSFISFVSLGLILLLDGCAQSTAGTLASPSSESVEVTTGYPGVVEIILPGGEALCSGTFVSPRAVLTASHCALNDGTYTVIRDNQTFTTTVHQNFGPGTVNDPNDIAVLVFSSDSASFADQQIITLGNQVAIGDTVRLVGYGCDDMTTETGAGIKRTGTNQVYQIDQYIDLLTPTAGTTVSPNAILGPSNRAGSCFGDSGSPLLRSNGSYLEVVGVVHAGGTEQSNIVSEFIDLTRADNINFLKTVDANYSLNLFDNCGAAGPNCNYQSASAQIVSFIKWAWMKIAAFF